MIFSWIKRFTGNAAVICCFWIFLLTPAMLQAASITYAYDASGRLVSAILSDGQRVALSYDDAGNITGLAASGSSTATPAATGLLLLENQTGNSFSQILHR